MEKGGVPQKVAEHYLELMRLYGTAAPTVGAAGARVMGPPPMLKKRSKRPADMDSESEVEDVATSDQAGRSNDTQHTRRTPLERAAKRVRLDNSVSGNGFPQSVSRARRQRERPNGLKLEKNE